MDRIPLVDLKIQYKNLRDEILRETDRLFSDAAFIGGKYLDDFEKAFAKFCDVEHVIGVANGTEALHVALRVLGIGVGDEVILPSHTFIATAEAVHLVGAKPVFAEIDEATWSLSAKTIQEKMTTRTKLIIPVHIYGYVVPDILEILALAKQHDILVLCDAAQAHGAFLNGKPVAHYGLLSTFSFYPGKNLGAFGDAGAIATNDSDLALRLRKFQDHGRLEKYIHDSVGTNARMDALQALILSIKLPYLQEWCDKRRQVARWYQERLSATEAIRLPYLGDGDTKPGFHLYVIRVDQKCREDLLVHLRKAHIEAGIHYPIPLHLQPCHQNLGYALGDFPVTEKIAKEIISLPIYPELDAKFVDYICEQIKLFFSNYSA
jgi:dTDP-4-amino-4,6-dideoxygalactose transaminase